MDCKHSWEAPITPHIPILSLLLIAQWKTVAYQQIWMGNSLNILWGKKMGVDGKRLFTYTKLKKAEAAPLRIQCVKFMVNQKVA